MIRLLHITTVPVSLSFFHGQVDYMRRRGLRFLALSSPGPELQAFAEREGVEVGAAEMPRRISPLQDLVAVTRIWWHIRRLRPEIVHSHTPKGGLLGMLAARLAGVPVRIYHIRGLPLVTATGYRRWLLTRAERVSARCAHQVLCVSHSLREVAVRERLCPPEKIRVLGGGSGNGVDAVGRFDPARLAPGAGAEVRRRHGIPEDATVLGFIGRIVRDKGVEELVHAWTRLRERFPDAHLLVVGPFEPQDPVSPGTEEVLRNDPRVHLEGLNWDTPPLYAAMDLLVLPTYREGFPNVLLEAAAMSLPVVSTRVPGCVDAVEDGATGTLVPARDADALARAMSTYLSEPELRRIHGAAARGRVLHEFRQEVIWDALHAEYTRLLGANGRAVPAADGTNDSPAYRGGSG